MNRQVNQRPKSAGFEILVFRSLTLICMFSVATTGFAASVNTQLTSGPVFQFQESSSTVLDDIVHGGMLAAEGSANIGTGTLRGYASTTVVPGAGGSSPDDRNAQANINLNNLVFSWGDPLGVYEIAPGQIGMNFEANYFRNSTNLDSGGHFFSLELLAQHRDASNDLLGFSRARIIHRVSFDVTGASEPTPPVNNLSGSGGIVDPGPGVYVEGSRSVNGISGTFLLPMFALAAGESLVLSSTLFIEATVGGVDPDVVSSGWPSSSVDASNTAQLFADIEPNPNLTVNTDVPLEWVGASPIPVPGAIWLFASAIGLLAFMRRKQAV